MKEGLLREIAAYAEEMKKTDCRWVQVRYSAQSAQTGDSAALSRLLRDLKDCASPEAGRFMEMLDMECPTAEGDTEDQDSRTAVDNGQSIEDEGLFGGLAGVENAEPATCPTVSWVRTGELNPHPLVEGLFPIETDLLDTLRSAMLEKGFDARFPIQCVENQGKLLVWDGLTRVIAAKMAELVQVPVVVSIFSSDDEMVETAVKVQHHRRAATDATILKSVELLSQKEAEKAAIRRGARTDLTSGQHCPEGGRANSFIAKLIGRSETTVKHAKSVLGNEELRHKVLRGELSLNKAYGLLKRSAQFAYEPVAKPEENVGEAEENPGFTDAEGCADAQQAAEADEPMEFESQEKLICIKSSTARQIMESFGSPESFFEILESDPDACQQMRELELIA